MFEGYTDYDCFGDLRPSNTSNTTSVFTLSHVEQTAYSDVIYTTGRVVQLENLHVNYGHL